MELNVLKKILLVWAQALNYNDIIHAFLNMILQRTRKKQKAHCFRIMSFVFIFS